MTNTMLHQGGDKIIEPIKKNAYRLLLGVYGLIPLLKSIYYEDNDYLETISTSLVGNLYPLEVSFIPPAIQVEQRKTRGKGNVEVKYAGYISYGNAEATFYNWIDLDTYKFFYRWASIAGASPLSRNDDALQNNIIPAMLPVPDFAADSQAGGYKVNGIVSTIHTINPLVGDEIENTRWILQGIFPTAVSAGDFSHADDGEPVLTNVSFSIDLALPASSLHPVLTQGTTPQVTTINTIV
jgi:hypothetical protein